MIALSEMNDGVVVNINIGPDYTINAGGIKVSIFSFSFGMGKRTHLIISFGNFFSGARILDLILGSG